MDANQQAKIIEQVVLGLHENHVRLVDEAHRNHDKRIAELDRTYEQVREIVPDALDYFINHYQGERFGLHVGHFFTMLSIAVQSFPRDRWYVEAMKMAGLAVADGQMRAIFEAGETDG